jgi:hypothetical protein
MATLYDRLTTIGISRAYAFDRVLPEWWVQECDEDPGVFLQGAMFLSRRLNISIKSLLGPGEIEFNPIIARRINRDYLIDVAIAMAYRIAEIVDYAACPGVQVPPMFLWFLPDIDTPFDELIASFHDRTISIVNCHGRPVETSLNEPLNEVIQWELVGEDDADYLRSMLLLQRDCSL